MNYLCNISNKLYFLPESHHKTATESIGDIVRQNVHLTAHYSYSNIPPNTSPSCTIYIPQKYCPPVNNGYIRAANCSPSGHH